MAKTRKFLFPNTIDMLHLAGVENGVYCIDDFANASYRDLRAAKLTTKELERLDSELDKAFKKLLKQYVPNMTSSRLRLLNIIDFHLEGMRQAVEFALLDIADERN